MNIQIWAGKKNFDSQKALRFFAERRIKVQQIDLLRLGMAARELDVFLRAVGLEDLLDMKKDLSHVILHMGDQEDQRAKLLAHPELLRTPLVRNGKAATVGYCPERWLEWLREADS